MFYLDRMMSLLHREIEFENISQNKVNAKATGIDEFSAMTEQSKTLFKSREQTIKSCVLSVNEASVEIADRGTLAGDLPNGMKSQNAIATMTN